MTLSSCARTSAPRMGASASRRVHPACCSTLVGIREALARFCFSALLFGVLISAYADVQYVYDDAGRLIQVTAPSGTSAQYTYDAAGNITGINQVAASTLSIVDFQAKRGQVGASVNVFGTGFSSTPSNNTVTFNGTAASVSSASPTQLSVSVPSAATSGPISVQVGTATATTSANYTVTSESAGPTISSFTPTIAITAGTVTVAGTNFDAVLSRDKLKFNGTPASLSSGTPTQLVTKIPIFATSGRLAITTSEGTGLSGADMFIPPAGYIATDVGYTARTTIGSTITVNPTATAKIGMLVFDGTQGQNLGIGLTNVTFSPGGGALTLYVKKPNGDDLTTPASVLSTGTGYSLPALPVSGTYSVLVIPNVSYGVSATASLSQDITTTISAGGSSVTTGTAYVGQKISLAFNGTAGQRVSLRIASISLSGGISLSLTILKPDGSTLASSGFVNSGGNFIDVQPLTATGTYAIVVDPASVSLLNTATLTLYDVPSDVTGSISPGGTTVTTSTTVPGQSANLAFAGTSGHRYSVAVTGASMTGQTGGQNWANVLLLKPDGTTLATVASIATTGFMEPQSLPSTGTYTVSFHPLYGSTGTATFALYDVPADPTGSITAGGSAVTTATTVPGQNANLTFGGTSGQRVSVLVSGISLTGQTPSFLNTASAILLKPDGSTLTSQGLPPNPFINTQSLPTTGTYTLRLDPAGSTIGTATFTLYNVPADVTSTVSINGTSTTLTISVPGENGKVTFAGTASQQVTVHVTGNSIGAGTVSLLRPDNSTMTFSSSSASSFNLSQQALPSTGTYTVYIDPSGAGTGSQTINVTSP